MLWTCCHRRLHWMSTRTAKTVQPEYPVDVIDMGNLRGVAADRNQLASKPGYSWIGSIAIFELVPQTIR
jgi:hypothetical protein